jgi:hypothetical protein
VVFNKNTNFDVQTLINRLKHIYMKQLLVVFGLLLMSANTYAQKNFSTSTAVVRFIAVDDTDIDATNKKAVSRLQTNGDLSFIMLMKDFTFDMDKMQEHFNEEYVESDKFPRAFFNGIYPITVSGNMQVHGVNKTMQTNGVIEIKGGKPVANAKFTVTLKDFGIGGVLIKMVADKINVEVTAAYQ